MRTLYIHDRPVSRREETLKFENVRLAAHITPLVPIFRADAGHVYVREDQAHGIFGLAGEGNTQLLADDTYAQCNCKRKNQHRSKNATYS